jgi:molybdopterin/thiamine biosynthesis adenylyltransferase
MEATGTQELTGIIKTDVKLNNKTARFRDADWYSPGMEVIVGGAGNVGSWLCLFLARQEAKIFLYEYDTIEELNLAGQLFKNSDIGKTKAEVTQTVVDTFTTGELLTLGKFDENSVVAPIVFSAFDSMSARKQLFNAWKKQINRGVFIDARTSMENGQVFCVIPGREEEYEKALYEDSEIPDLPCNLKSTSHCGAIIAGLMVSVFNNYVSNKKHNLDMRSIPFKFEYDLQLLNFVEYDKEISI